jgi:hypothetical protein
MPIWRIVARMIEQIGNWIHQCDDRIHDHRKEHHRKALQTMVDRLNQWDYKYKDPYTTADFLTKMVIEARYRLDSVVDDMQPEEMPDELVQFCKKRTEDQRHRPIYISFPDIYEMDVSSDQNGSQLYFFLHPYDRHHPPISVWGYGKGADKYEQNSPQWNLELMGKTIAAAASHALSQC